MLFKVEMEVIVPHDVDPEVFESIKSKEKEYASELQSKGVWRHLWRVAGEYKNISIFDVDSNQALHDTLMGLPLYPYMNVEVTPLCRHPSSIHNDDR
ncbi:muconolactone Delta-isomerase [Dasania marina]|uniref:muconolactone Delta-isomerase n=1 Tax=Dasania marina TaxID=471499 RepID=UPI0030DC1790|tara:strand:- start:64327 stop:64617 length:291 start_codon:yes stop_codon:yes gene_type:complete